LQHICGLVGQEQSLLDNDPKWERRLEMANVAIVALMRKLIETANSRVKADRTRIASAP
jgi:hypothetical protein